MNNITFYFNGAKNAMITDTEVTLDEIGKMLNREFIHFEKQNIIINTKNITFISCVPVKGNPPKKP